jgi:hypothetical protein
MSSAGIVWAVDGDEAQREWFRLSHATARRHCPSLPRLVFRSGSPLGLGSEEQPVDRQDSGFHLKREAFCRTPFRKTIFLDNDTLVLRDLSRFPGETRYVAALPYPDFFQAEDFSVTPDGAALPRTWRNVNSGVVVYDRSFVDHYRTTFTHVATRRQVDGDQWGFSLALATAPTGWTPRLDLQVTATPHALDYLGSLRGLGDPEPRLGDIPYALLASVGVIHFTHEKGSYLNLLRETGLLDQILAEGVVAAGDLDRFPYPRGEVSPGP